ncbi:MAG: hypothetical protein FJ206_07865 [Gemmatimonadetes bacterium]|nr:hypothetical protein [Gemmatimonadota bacterium]
MATLTLIGLAVGTAVGFLLGELYSREGSRRLSAGWGQLRARFGPGANPGERADTLQQRIEEALGPDSSSLEIVPVGREAVELHGWVSSRTARTRAFRAARAALDPKIRLIDRLLVWGEDDGPLPAAPRFEES